MNRMRVHARRLAGTLAGLAATLLSISAGAPAAFALPQTLTDPGGGGGRANIGSGLPVPTDVHRPGGGLPCSPTCQPVVASRLEGPGLLTARRPHGAVSPHFHAATGGMPGWQITMIAIGAALAAATLAVLLDRVFTSRRRVSPTAV